MYVRTLEGPRLAVESRNGVLQLDGDVIVGCHTVLVPASIAIVVVSKLCSLAAFHSSHAA